jgi:hypothetical protein
MYAASSLQAPELRQKQNQTPFEWPSYAPLLAYLDGDRAPDEHLNCMVDSCEPIWLRMVGWTSCSHAYKDPCNNKINPPRGRQRDRERERKTKKKHDKET